MTNHDARISKNPGISLNFLQHVLVQLKCSNAEAATSSIIWAFALQRTGSIPRLQSTISWQLYLDAIAKENLLRVSPFQNKHLEMSAHFFRSCSILVLVLLQDVVLAECLNVCIVPETMQTAWGIFSYQGSELRIVLCLEQLRGPFPRTLSAANHFWEVSGMTETYTPFIGLVLQFS